MTIIAIDAVSHRDRVSKSGYGERERTREADEGQRELKYVQSSSLPLEASAALL